MNYLSWMNIKVKNPKITFLLTFITKQKKPLLNSNARPVKFNRNGRIITKNTIRRIRKKHNCRTQTIVKMYFTFTGDLRAHVVFSYVYDYTRASLVRNVGHFVPNRFTKQSSCRASLVVLVDFYAALSSPSSVVQFIGCSILSKNDFPNLSNGLSHRIHLLSKCSNQRPL